MSLREELLELETAVYRMSKGVNAVQLMSLGLNRAIDPYAEDFGALCDYLTEADSVLRKQMDACLKAV